MSARERDQRANALRDEYEAIQKKTFTKWANSLLADPALKIDDLYKDLADGKRLLKLLEVISGDPLPIPSSRAPMQRIHFLQNVNKAIKFLTDKQVKLESIGAQDIVDGNKTLVLGLIWTIILRFQIQDIKVSWHAYALHDRS